MFDWSTPAASIIVVVSAVFALMRWNPPEWWKRIGFWFWRQELGPEQPWEGWSTCWKRVVPPSFAKWVQKLFLTDKEYEEHAAKQQTAPAGRLDSTEALQYSLHKMTTHAEMQLNHERRFTHRLFCNGNTPVTVAVVVLLVWALIVLSTSLAD